MPVPTKGAVMLELAHLTGMNVSEIRSISHTPYFDKLYDSLKARRSSRKRRAEKIKTEINADMLRTMYDDGASIVGLARYFGCSTWTIFELFRQHSIKPRPRGFPKQYAYPSREELENMYLSNGGMTQAEIAKTIGCSTGMIQKIMKEYGFAANQRKVGLTRDDMLREYVVEKLGLAKIARLHGCSAHAVRYALCKYGIPVRPPKRMRLDYGIIKEMRIHRTTWETIAKNLGCAKSTVKNFYRKERSLRAA